MAEGTIQANSITLWYETFGIPIDPALVLIMGRAIQGVGWPTEFCERLAAAGRYVVRFDNREVGLSTYLDEDATYTLEDMADDVVGLLDALGLAQAHVVGMSMGGAIAQWLAIRHPERTATLTLLASSAYTREEALAAGLRPLELDRNALYATPDPGTLEGRIQRSVGLWRQVWGTHPFDEAEVTARDTVAFTRADRPEAGVRQDAANARTPSRVAALRTLTVPTLVLHGTADPMVPPDRGEATAALIPGARLLLIEGMGHSLPRACWDELVTAIREHTAMRSTSPQAL